MASLELDERERVVLRELLEQSLSDLRMEIADTDRADFRDALKERKAVLGRLLERLGQD